MLLQSRLFTLPVRHQLVVRFNSSVPVLTLFTKRGECSLCDDMKDSLNPWIEKNIFVYKEVDISKTENSYWKSRYKYEIPVLHLNGKLIMKHRFDEEKLKSALNEAEAPATPKTGNSNQR